MHATADEVRTLDDLRRFIHRMLCQKENLLDDQYRTTEFRLIRGERFCGLQFCLRGPRSVRLAAVWVADHNLVYLYDATGKRYSKLRLTNHIPLPAHAQAPGA
jgi:hypothetical protein